MAEKLEILTLDKCLRNLMEKNDSCCEEERFDRRNSYKEIIESIEN